MSDAYLASDGIDDYIQLDNNISIAAGQNYRIEIDFQAVSDAQSMVRLYGRLDSDGSRFTINKGDNGVLMPYSIAVSGAFNCNILKRQTVALERYNGTTHALYIDGNELPTVANTNAAISISVLLTQNSATGSRNPVNFYGMRVWIDGVLAHNYEPAASFGSGNILYDTVGGNNGTLVNFATDGSQWGVGGITTKVVKRVAPAGGDYTTLAAALADVPLNLVTENTYYVIEVEDFGPNGLLGANNIAGVTSDVTRTLEIRAAPGHEYKLLTDSGAKLVCSTNWEAALTVNVPYAKVAGLYLEHTGVSAAHAFSGSSSYRSLENCVLKVNPVASDCFPIQANNSKDLFLNKVITFNGDYSLYFNNYAYNVRVVDVICINPKIAAIQKGTQTTPFLRGVIHYGTGLFAETPAGFFPTLNSSKDNASSAVLTPGVGSNFRQGITEDVFVDYQNNNLTLVERDYSNPAWGKPRRLFCLNNLTEYNGIEDIPNSVFALGSSEGDTVRFEVTGTIVDTATADTSGNSAQEFISFFAAPGQEFKGDFSQDCATLANINNSATVGIFQSSADNDVVRFQGLKILYAGINGAVMTNNWRDGQQYYLDSCGVEAIEGSAAADPAGVITRGVVGRGYDAVNKSKIFATSTIVKGFNGSGFINNPNADSFSDVYTDFCTSIDNNRANNLYSQGFVKVYANNCFSINSELAITGAAADSYGDLKAGSGNNAGFSGADHNGYTRSEFVDYTSGNLRLLPSSELVNLKAGAFLTRATSSVAKSNLQLPAQIEVKDSPSAKFAKGLLDVWALDGTITSTTGNIPLQWMYESPSSPVNHQIDGELYLFSDTAGNDDDILISTNALDTLKVSAAKTCVGVITPEVPAGASLSHTLFLFRDRDALGLSFTYKIDGSAILGYNGGNGFKYEYNFPAGSLVFDQPNHFVISVSSGVHSVTVCLNGVAYSSISVGPVNSVGKGTLLASDNLKVAYGGYSNYYSYKGKIHALAISDCFLTQEEADAIGANVYDLFTPTVVIDPEPAGGLPVKYHNGTAFVPGQFKVYQSGEWVLASAKVV